MPTATIVVYNSWAEQSAKNAIAASDTWIMGLSTSTYTPSQSGHSTLSDITNEVSGSGYARQTLASVTLNRSGAVLTLDFADPVFPASGGDIVAYYWWIYNDTTASDYLVAYGLLDNAPADVTITDTNSLTVIVNALGIITWTRG